MQGLTIYNASLMSYQLIHALHAAFEPILRQATSMIMEHMVLCL